MKGAKEAGFYIPTLDSQAKGLWGILRTFMQKLLKHEISLEMITCEVRGAGQSKS